jgi:hypothetical protein
LIGNQQNDTFYRIYQPQIIRILKTLEIVGLYNEFNQGALCSFYTRKLSQDEKDSYLKNYLEWAVCS